MKKVLLTLLTVSCVTFSLLAADLSAVTSSGRAVLLHDDGTWEYDESSTSSSCIGRWEMSEEELDSVIDTYLAQSGIDTASATYSFYKSYMKELIMQQLNASGMTAVITLDIAGDGTCTISSGDDYVKGTYTIGPDRVLNVTVDDVVIFYGVFDESFKKLTIDGEEFFFLTKSE